MNYTPATKILVLSLILVTAANFVSANWTPAPASTGTNTAAPINSGTASQDKTGALSVNESSSPYGIGAQVQNGVLVTSAIPDAARVYIDEYDTSFRGSPSGIHFQKNGTMMGGLTKRVTTVAGAQDISIWNSTKTVINVRQDDSVEFTGQIKIRGGNPGNGKVLTSDASGNATWVTPAVPPSSTPTVTMGPITEHLLWNVENPFGGGANATQIEASICPDGKAMVGFHIANSGANYSKSNPTYCR